MEISEITFSMYREGITRGLVTPRLLAPLRGPASAASLSFAMEICMQKLSIDLRVLLQPQQYEVDHVSVLWCMVYVCLCGGFKLQTNTMHWKQIEVALQQHLL